MGAREILDIGFGAALLFKEKVESELDDLAKRGKISQEDAKEVIERAKEKAKEQKESSKDELKRVLKEIIDELGVATKEDIENLKIELKK